MTDLVAGQLVLGVAPIGVITGAVRDGQLTAIAVSSSERSQFLPDVKTLAEYGYPEAGSVSWYDLHAPAGTSPVVSAKISEAVRLAAADPAVINRIHAGGAEPTWMDSKPFEAFLREELKLTERYVRLIAPKN